MSKLVKNLELNEELFDSLASIDVTTALGYTPENVANKKSTLSDNSETYYPNQKAVNDGLALKENLSTATVVKQTEIDFGSTPIDEKTFTITDTDVATASNIVAQVAYKAPTDKSLDELEFDTFDFRAVAGSGSFTLYARSLEGYVADKFFINYTYNKG